MAILLIKRLRQRVRKVTMKRLTILIFSSCMFWASGALASIVVDGGFEDHLPQTQPERFFGGSSFGGWLVGGQGIDYVDLHWDPLNAIEGNQYLFMKHSGADVSQAVALQVGHVYELQVFASAIHGQGFGQIDVVSLYPAGTLHDRYDIGTATVEENPIVPPFSPPLRWHEYRFTFTAHAENERLFFRNGSTGYLLLDNIGLVHVAGAVPEPASAMVWLLLLVTRIPARVRS